MTKQEFMEKLKLSLNGKIHPGLVVDNLQYYEDYINTEIRKGTPESEVLEKLGDPRLIARTIVETSGGGLSGEAGGSWYEDQEEGQEEYQSYAQPDHRGLHILSKIPPWAWLLLVLLIVMLVVGAVFSLLATLLPILLPIAIVVFLVKAFRDWIN